MPPKRDREGNEEDILVFRARSADEALQVRNLLAEVDVELEMPDAAVQVMFAKGRESLDIRVPLEQADTAHDRLLEAFGEERMPEKEGALHTDDVALDDIEARARELEAEDERRRQKAEERLAAGEPEDGLVSKRKQAAEKEETPTEKIIYGLLSLALLAALVWWLLTHQMR